MERERTGPRQPQPLEAWEDWVDRLIREAQERGEFDNLPGQGKPLQLEDAPYAGGLEVGFGLLKNAGVAPGWIEADKAVRAAREALDTLHALVVRAAAEPAPPAPEPPPARGWRLFRSRPARPPAAPDPTEWRAAERARLRAAYVAAAEELDKRVATFNAAIPRELWALERVRQPAEAAEREFDALWEAASTGSEAVRGHEGR